MSSHLRSSSALPINLDVSHTPNISVHYLAVQFLRLYTKQLLGVIYYLHSNGIVHRDLKVSTILLFDQVTMLCYEACISFAGLYWSFEVSRHWHSEEVCVADIHMMYI